MFTLAISCLTTSDLPWFMDLTFQVSMQCCSSQQQTLLSPPDISTLGHCFHSGSAYSFLLELFLHSFPVAYWTPTNLGSSSLSILSFCLFTRFMGFLRQEYWSGLPFPSPVDHIFSELSTMTCLSWLALHGMAHSFIELDKAVVHVIRLVSFSLSIMPSRSIHVVTNHKVSFFMANNSILCVHVHTHTTLSLPIHPVMDSQDASMSSLLQIILYFCSLQA